MSARPPSQLGRWRFHVGAVPIDDRRRRRRGSIRRSPGRARSSTRGSASSGRRCSRSRTATVFPGIAFGAADAAGGDLVVNTTQTGYQEVCTDPSYAGQVVVMTYPLIGNYGRLADDDQSIRPWLRALVVANATAAVARRRPPAGVAPARRRASRRSPASTRGRSPATCARAAASAAIVTRARVRRPRRRRRAGAGRAALGGPGLRRPGVAVVDHGRRPGGRRRAAGRDRRLRAEDEHRPRPCAGAARGSGSCRTRSRPRWRWRRDIDGVILSPGPGDPARLDGPGRAGPGGHRRRPAAARDLPRPPDRRPGRRRRDDPAPVRPPRREPPGPRRRPRARPGDRPEPRGPGRRRRRCRPAAASTSAR